MEPVAPAFVTHFRLYNAYDPNPTVRNYYLNGTGYKNGGSTAIPYYKVHTGQVFFIRNLQFEVMYTHEDIHPWAMEFYNNTSTVIRLTAYYTNGNGAPVAGSAAPTNMILGDLQVRGSMVMRARYGDYLKSDMVQVAHHGGNGVEAALYEDIDAQVLWWTHSADSMKEYTSPSGTWNPVKENVKWLSTTRWLYIFTLNPLSANMTSNEYVNLTMTLGASGIPGLYSRLETDSGDKLTEKQEAGQAALLANLFDMHVKSSNWIVTTNWSYTAGSQGGHGITFGTGTFTDSSYSGNGFLIGRQNYPYELPVLKPEIEGPLGDTYEDPFPEEITPPQIIFGW